MKKHYLFDVDGTLTPSRQKIDPIFKQFMMDFCTDNSVSLVSGSDYEKTVEQLGEDLADRVRYCFSCSGNWVRDTVTKQITERHVNLPVELVSWLEQQLANSAFHIRTGRHFENRTGTLNFSIVGRNCSLEQRASYVEWDNRYQERMRIATGLNQLFPHLEATVGGETGIDITVRGCNKSQVLSWFDKDTKLIFFGDATHLGGNDYPLADVIVSKRRGVVYTVRSWTETYETLQHLSEV